MSNFEGCTSMPNNIYNLSDEDISKYYLEAENHLTRGYGYILHIPRTAKDERDPDFLKKNTLNIVNDFLRRTKKYIERDYLKKVDDQEKDYLRKVDDLVSDYSKKVDDLKRDFSNKIHLLRKEK